MPGVAAVKLQIIAWRVAGAGVVFSEWQYAPITREDLARLAADGYFAEYLCVQV